MTLERGRIAGKELLEMKTLKGTKEGRERRKSIGLRKRGEIFLTVIRVRKRDEITIIMRDLFRGIFLWLREKGRKELGHMSLLVNEMRVLRKNTLLTRLVMSLSKNRKINLDSKVMRKRLLESYKITFYKIMILNVKITKRNRS